MKVLIATHKIANKYRTFNNMETEMRKEFILILMFLVISNICYALRSWDCAPARITVQFAEDNGCKLAASFVAGEYVAITAQTSRGDMLLSDTIISDLAGMSESSRLQYPEYVVVKNFGYKLNDDLTNAVNCFEPGFSRIKEQEVLDNTGSVLARDANQNVIMNNVSGITAQIQAMGFTKLIFVSKNLFGPYIRINYVLFNPTLGRGFPAKSFLKYSSDDSRYYMTWEVGHESSIYADIVEQYEGVKIMQRQSVTLNPTTTGMEWFKVDPDATTVFDANDVDAELNLLTAYSNGAGSISSSNYLQIYIDGESIGTELIAGQQDPNLVGAMALLDDAVTDHSSGTQAEIIAYWDNEGLTSSSSGYKFTSQGKINGIIANNVTNGSDLWGHLPFSESTKVIAKIETADTTFYFLEGALIRGVGINASSKLHHIGRGPSSVRKLLYLDNSPLCG